MTRIRRGLVLLAIVVTAVLTGTGPAAQASFADSVGVSTSIATGTVAAPVIGPGSLTCGRSTATMALTWTKSTSARVSGYRVTVYFSDGYSQTEPLTTGTSWSKGITLYQVQAYAVRYTVTTQTEYGWTAESTSTGWFQCSGS
jgi:hypothetical protein